MRREIFGVFCVKNQTRSSRNGFRKGLYKNSAYVAESTILVVSKAQSRICNESLLDKGYCIYWIIEFQTFFFVERRVRLHPMHPHSDGHVLGHT